MRCKNFTKKDLIGKRCAIIIVDEEDPMNYIEGLYSSREIALSKYKKLREQAKRDFIRDVGIYDYIISDVNDIEVRKCFNFESEED